MSPEPWRDTDAWKGKLAWEVDELIRHRDAMPRFREMVRNWAGPRATEAEEARKWWARVKRHSVRVSREPRLQDYEAGPPEPRWKWRQTSCVGQGKVRSRARIDGLPWDGWFPPDLACEADPKIKMMPPREGQPTIEHMYAALSALHDLYCLQTERVAPWGWDDKSGLPARLLDDDKECLAADMYFFLVRNEKSNLPPIGPAEVLAGYLDRVKADLAGRAPAAPTVVPAVPQTPAGQVEPVGCSHARAGKVRTSLPAQRRRKHVDRGSLSRHDEAEVLEKCRRRCCICFGLDHDASVKTGQLAHLDHDRSNNGVSNFVFLCLTHHETYDSKTSQTKNLTEKEVRLYQRELHQAVERGEVHGRKHRGRGTRN